MAKNDNVITFINFVTNSVLLVQYSVGSYLELVLFLTVTVIMPVDSLYLTELRPQTLFSSNRVCQVCRTAVQDTSRNMYSTNSTSHLIVRIRI